MSELPIQLLVAALAGLMSGWGANFLKDFISRRFDRGMLRLKSESGEAAVTLPEPSSPQNVEKRLTALLTLSPRLAVLDSWRIVSQAVVEAAFGRTASALDSTADIIAIVRKVPNMSNETIGRIDRLRELRNMVAHSLAEDSPTQSEIRATLTDVSEIMVALRPDWSNESAAILPPKNVLHS